MHAEKPVGKQPLGRLKRITLLWILGKYIVTL